MSEPKLISPLLDRFMIGEMLSCHDGVRCYPAMREDSDEKYIVKIISVPASPKQLDALLLSGAYKSQDAALAYFKELSDDTVNEAEALQYLSKLEGFISYESWQLVPKENEVGYDIYLLGTYKRSLEKHLQRNPMTQLGAINLGIDLCSALAVCRRAGCLYIDLKPNNIFIMPDQTYRIGDLGLIPLDALKYASLPEKYRSSYTAPEIKDAYSALNATVDIYALGLILYRIYNNGVLPFDGNAPAEVFPAPENADYEMAEIILKACAPDPADRWQDPVQMGQALVGYMQRNGANDIPIVPPVIETPAEAAPAETEAPITPLEAVSMENVLEDLGIADEAAAQEEDSPAADVPVPVDDVADLSFIDHMVSDETAPTEESASELDDTKLSIETSEILAQADELIAHEAPEPVVAPDPIDVPMPEPIVLEDPQEPETEQPEAEENEEAEAPQPAEDDDKAPVEGPEEAETDAEEKNEEDMPAEEAPRKKKKHRGWIAVLIVLALLAGIGFGGYYYYQNYYLQPVEAMELIGNEDKLTVNLTTQIPSEQLTVICTDTYGNAKREALVDGSASFSELNPATQYTITLEIKGFHQLTGEITKSYATANRTNIANFTAITGSEDGSVILNLTVDGTEPEEWTISYTAEGEEEKTVSFTGHMVNITGLTVGKEYTFRLLPSNDLYLIGMEEITFTASNVIYAQDLTIDSFDDGTLTASWGVPAGESVSGWNVRCYNDAGMDQTIQTADTTAVFTGIDSNAACMVEVTANGMTKGTQTSITANPVTIASVLTDDSNAPAFYLQWGFDGPVPEGGWTVTVCADGSEPLEVIHTDENSAEISVLIPGAHYTIIFQPANGTTVFNGTYTYDAPEAEEFSGYWVSAENMEFRMCRTPENSDWDRSDLSDEDYTTTFASGEKASFLVYMNRSYDTSKDNIVAMFVIRNADGVPVIIDTDTRTWSAMWYKRYCEINIPEIPTDAGNYTIEVYFNGKYVTTQEFTVQ